MTTSKLPKALWLAELLQSEPGSVADAAAAELRRLNAVEVEANLLVEREWQRNKVLSDRIAALEQALDVAEQFMEIAADWNLDEAEINGEMKRTYDWLEMIRAARQTLGGKHD